MKNSILIITGGTGGHVIPAVNFYKYIKYYSLLKQKKELLHD